MSNAANPGTIKTLKTLNGVVRQHHCLTETDAKGVLTSHLNSFGQTVETLLISGRTRATKTVVWEYLWSPIQNLWICAL